MMRSRPRPAARRRFARTGRVAEKPEPGESPGVDESLARQSRLPLPGAAGGAQPAGLDDLPLDGKTPSFAQPAQAPQERQQVARLQALRARRDSTETQAALTELERRARTNENLLPAILAAVESFATVGEISDALRQVFGEYQESVVL